MAINNVTTKSFISTFKTVSESFNSGSQKDGRNFYQRQERKKRELPEDRDELFDLLSDELKKFEETSVAKNTKGFKYKVVRESEKIFVLVENKDGDFVREMDPEEFMEVCKNSKGEKGTLLNSVY